MQFANSMVLYGVSGMAKTSNAGFYAKYIYATMGKMTRMISADKGGYSPILPLVKRLWTPERGWEGGNEHGIIELVDIRFFKYPASIWLKLAEGMWPANEMGKGPKGGVQLRMNPAGGKTWEEVGAYVNEGLSSMGMAFLKSLRASGVKLSEKPNYNHKETVDGLGEATFYGSNQSYYGWTQDTVYDVISTFGSLPVRVLWTSLEGSGEEEQTKQTIIGPDIPGKKAIARVPQWVGECLHVYSPATQKGKAITGKTEIQIWFQRHHDVIHQGVPYPAKARVPPEMMPALLERWNKGWLPSEFEQGIDVFLKFEDELQARAGKGLEAWKKKVRG